ncbi:hypothetical protein [Pseudoxanthomonas mexicana]|uniref:hypothetical protein n=1 Tax=Pseudoxanthomonas mexicana TaxID=128785 RepID=UPI0007824654|nr:hypothetical protein [Pseudoxanthomonas mexicana]
MVDQPLHERLSHLEGWDDMSPEAKFEAIRNADLLLLLDNGIGRYKIDELVAMAEDEGDELDDYLDLYITDPDDHSCDYYNISDLDQFEGGEVMAGLGELFPELEIDEDDDFDAWLRVYVRRERLGTLGGRGAPSTERGKL